MKKSFSKARFNDQACHCQSDKNYGDCCGHWHEAFYADPPEHAPSPEALMRSRYSAYALQLGDYLLATWHVSTRPENMDFPPTKWLGLEVKHSAQSQGAGVVEFVARYRDSSGRAGRIEESSRFIKEGVGVQARWFYIDGQIQ